MRSLAHLAFPLLVLRAWLVLSSPSPGSESMPYPLTVTALGTDGEKPIGAATELVVWPGVAAGYRAGRDPISNAERLKRDLPLKSPRKLYQQKKVITPNLNRRINNAPPQARASGGSRVYTTDGDCYTNINFQEQYRLTYTSLQDLADQCAARQDDYNARTAGSGFPTSATFALGMVINNCFLSATLSGAGPCDASNLVQYVPSN
ncbi:uncharacterized protein MKK02DRAFT_29589 [Dioszegia hungarica]|uniref:Uncharacterized protein n=1 Tax=Dioszegia hungarica TaxID=4972 RepID=A0AA38HH69_9TREE|nr:uncharacterized protein MKK02DRAFT_29589 [Dioszegia hungarica]KAI9639551.1 hypothetical protein MKK02DRAFT_29589 [Dioszegia hungarica]